MGDLATHLQLSSANQGMDVLLRLMESKSWEDIIELSKYMQVLPELQRLPFEDVVIKGIATETEKLESELKSLEDSTSDSCATDSYPIVCCGIQLLSLHGNFSKLGFQLSKFFDLRQQLVQKIAQLSQNIELGDETSKDHDASQTVKNKLQKSLLLLKRIPGHIQSIEQSWSYVGDIPQNRLEAWPIKSKLERCHQLSEQFFEEKIIPKIILQRRDLAAFLFRSHFDNTLLKPEHRKAYIDALKKATKLQEACHLKLIQNQESNKAKKILYQLQWIQCLLPPQSIVDFISSYFEFRFLPPMEDSEKRIKSLIQAEQQLPSTELWLSTPANQRQKLLPYLQGLRKRISEAKAKTYLVDERPSRALEDIISGLKQGWEWSATLLESSKSELLPHLEEIVGDDEDYLINLHLKRLTNTNPYQEQLESSCSSHFDQSTQELENPGEDALFIGVTELCRAIQLGFPSEQSESLLQQYLARIQDAKDKKLQSLSLEVGSALGEALSTRSLSGQTNQSAVAKGDVGQHLQKLYENFKDVMLQQDPFANETKKALEDILSQANSLIQEAKSIEQSRKSTVMEDILNGEDKESMRLLLTDFKSIQNLVKMLHLDPELLETNKDRFKLPVEQLLMHSYTDFLSHVISRQIKHKDNPLLNHFGAELTQWINFGLPSPIWWKDEESMLDAAHEKFPVMIDEPFSDGAETEKQNLIENDRYIICRMFEWLKFENEEALKVPYRKAMSICCSHITNGIVAIRKLAQEKFQTILDNVASVDPNGMLRQFIESMRKASAQINSLDIMKNSGILPVKFDRSIEPRVRAFLENCTKNLAETNPKVFQYVQEQVPKVYALDRSEFALGTLLGDKEKALKRYLHMNLSELTQSYLRPSNKSSLPNKINNSCLRVQQGINFRRSDSRNLRYSPVIFDNDHIHTPQSILEKITAYEEMFPIIDRISGSRQIMTENDIKFSPDDHGLSQEGMNLYQDQVERYLSNALKLARQLRIIVIPGQGTGNYDPTTHTLCIPMHTGNGRSEDMTILSALADYLYHVKVVNEGSEIEEEICHILNKKGKSSLKPGTHDAKLKITQLLYQELGGLAGVDRLQRNAENISNILGRAILGTDQTMIYRDLRELSAPQKQQRYKSDKKLMSLGERVAEVCCTYLDEPDIDSEYRKKYSTRVFHRLNESIRHLIRDEIYDLGVLFYHYRCINEAFQAFEFITQVEPEFPEAHWGLGTSTRHVDMNLLAPMQKQSIAIGAFKRFSNFQQVGPFWKKRANDLSKKLSEEMS